MKFIGGNRTNRLKRRELLKRIAQTSALIFLGPKAVADVFRMAFVFVCMTRPISMPVQNSPILKF